MLDGVTKMVLELKTGAVINSTELINNTNFNFVMIYSSPDNIRLRINIPLVHLNVWKR